MSKYITRCTEHFVNTNKKGNRKMSIYTVIYASPNTAVGTRGQVGIRIGANTAREALALADTRRDALGGMRARYIFDGIKLDGEWVNLRDRG